MVRIIRIARRQHQLLRGWMQCQTLFMRPVQQHLARLVVLPGTVNRAQPAVRQLDRMIIPLHTPLAHAQLSGRIQPHQLIIPESVASLHRHRSSHTRATVHAQIRDGQRAQLTPRQIRRQLRELVKHVVGHVVHEPEKTHKFFI